MEEKNPIQSAERIFGVLELLAEEGELGLMEISHAMGLNKATVHRMLASLIHMEYARQNESSQKYSLTYKLVTLSGKILGRTKILDIARPYLEELSQRSGETVHLVQLDGDMILYIDKVESMVGSIRMASYVGMRHPMYCSGVGKAILSAMEEEEQRKILALSQIHQLTPYTITDPELLLANIQKAKELGYALDEEENELGVRCIAAQLNDYSQKARYAFSISGPVNRMTDERMEELKGMVLEVKERLSRELGSVRG